ncbi:DUF2399 domain-containing protein [Actinoplanes sp. NPDC051475]|uniref:DUF2399 domain-containing protein n=1 Tax=Actinoplanes sp. NPDC051475 TaxID=3157225 RepID=UPI00344B9AC8
MSDLHNPQVIPLWQAIKDRYIETGDLSAIKTVRVRLTTAGLALINAWLAHSRAPRLIARDGWARVPVERLLHALGPTADLTTILRDTVGLPDITQPRRRLAAMKSDFWTYAQTVLPETPRLLQHLRAGGLSEPAKEERQRLIDALARAHDLIPLQRPIPLPRLSFYCAADPHYFDLNAPGHGAKLVMLAAELQGEEPVKARSPHERVALLSRCGIYPDRISSTVITLHLDAAGDGPVDQALQHATATSRPVHLTLYDLTMFPPRFCDSGPVLVVENPSVVEEALIRRYPGPIACTSGSLSAVDHQFLQMLAHSGVNIRYSGDHDPAGLVIAEAVRTRYGADIVDASHLLPPDATVSNAVLYQEDHEYLAMLVGLDPSDPLATRH